MFLKCKFVSFYSKIIKLLKREALKVVRNSVLARFVLYHDKSFSLKLSIALASLNPSALTLPYYTTPEKNIFN